MRGHQSDRAFSCKEELVFPDELYASLLSGDSPPTLGREQPRLDTPRRRRRTGSSPSPRQYPAAPKPVEPTAGRSSFPVCFAAPAYERKAMLEARRSSPASSLIAPTSAASPPPSPLLSAARVVPCASESYRGARVSQAPSCPYRVSSGCGWVGQVSTRYGGNLETSRASAPESAERVARAEILGGVRSPTRVGGAPEESLYVGEKDNWELILSELCLLSVTRSM